MRPFRRLSSRCGALWQPERHSRSQLQHLSEHPHDERAGRGEDPLPPPKPPRKKMHVSAAKPRKNRVIGSATKDQGARLTGNMLSRGSHGDKSDDAGPLATTGCRQREALFATLKNAGETADERGVAYARIIDSP